MRFPPRLSHLATRAVVVAKLLPTYAAAHQIDDDEARLRLEAALRGSLLDDLLAAAWESMGASTKRLSEDGLLQKVAKTLHDRPLRPGRVAELNPAWSAFLILADLAAGTATDSAARVMESERGREMAKAGVNEAGAHLAKELTRGK
jgi:hypothetical protein